jgi:2-keto-4-pentenoate hydratase/2-oxohepta-3-ene-1,7-dioic acid hydratase in catechol pathway
MAALFFDRGWDMETYARMETGGRAAYACQTEDGSFQVLDRAPWLGGVETGERVAPAEARMLVPAEPSKIVCVGLNYELHIRESASRDTAPDEPVLFLKPPSALLDPGESIRLPPGVGRVDHEAEVALIIGTRLTRVSVEEARRGIFGVTALNDVSARVLQKKDGQWTRAKGFDTFCPLGPVAVRGLDPDCLAVSSRVNGELRQSATTRDFLFDSGELVSFISGVMTLLPGDVVSTGTPAGVGPLTDGDRVEVEVEGVGVLANRVRGV